MSGDRDARGSMRHERYQDLPAPHTLRGCHHRWSRRAGAGSSGGPYRSASLRTTPAVRYWRDVGEDNVWLPLDWGGAHPNALADLTVNCHGRSHFSRFPEQAHPVVPLTGDHAVSSVPNVLTSNFVSAAAMTGAGLGAGPFPSTGRRCLSGSAA
jgi:hypothetical protein